LGSVDQEFIRTIFWAVGIVAGLIAAFRAIHEIRENRIQRNRDFIWNKVKLAHDMMEELWGSKEEEKGSFLLLL
jgi:hypothetical protein